MMMMMMFKSLRDEEEFISRGGMRPAVKRMAHFSFGQFYLHGTAALGSGIEVVWFAVNANSSSQSFRNGAFTPGKDVLQSTRAGTNSDAFSSGC